MKNKKELAIVFGITSDYDFALANVLIGIKKHFNYKNEYDIIVYHDGLNEEIKETLNKIMPCTFFKFKSRVNEKLLSEENLKLYSNMCLARFECFDLLKKYRKVIWHDVDILIQDNFSELLKLGEKSGLAMTYTDIDFLTEANFNEIIPNYNMFLPLLNSGIMVFGDKLSRYEEMTNWCYKKLSELNKKVRYLDQGILNLLVQEYNINVEPIDINKFCCHPARKNYKKASIIHAYGFDKFWNANYLYEKFPEWQSNLLEWAKLKKEYYFENRKDEKPLVSVIMSIFKRVSFLDEAIESILNQTFANFELLIVVEYSEEQENINNYIFKKFKDKRIRIINNKERLGFAESLNVGIKSAKGKYIARMDDDDISLPLRFEKQVNFLEKNKDITFSFRQGITSDLIKGLKDSKYDVVFCSYVENEENIVIKYKLLRSLIIKHYHRGCKYLEIAKIVCAIFFLIFTAVGLIVCSNGGSKAFWLIMWIIIIFVLVNIFLITDYCKYLVKSKVIPYLEDDNQIEFGEYSIFAEDKNEAEDDEDDEYEEELRQKKFEKKQMREQKKKDKKQSKKDGRAKK